MSGRLFLLLTFVGAFVAAQADRAFAAKPVAAAGLEFFEKKIRPVLAAQCYECHSTKSKIVQANLYLDTREGIRRGGDSGPAVVPGDGGQSLIIEALRYESYEMPPQGKLDDAIIADFVKWIELGAPDPRDGKVPTAPVVDVEKGRAFWAYQRPQTAAPPSVRNQAWPRTEIDRYVLAGLEAAKLQPSADAEPRALVRRLYFDLLGLPPTPEEVEAFVADTSPQAVERLVDRLLASPQFGERWGRHWLDLARYAESSGKERNVPYRMAWRYRDYVIDAFNADMPYDQFIREQLAGDLLPASSTAERDRQLIATGFLAVGPRALTERDPEKFLLDVADEQLDATCRVFLASTAACARCHDHKFDPIPTTDYYALIGIFRSTDNICGVAPQRREFSYFRAAALGDDAERDGPSRKLQEAIRELELETDRLSSAYRAATKKKDPAEIEAVKRQQAEILQQLTAARARAESDAEGRFAMVTRDRGAAADYAVRIRGEVEMLGPVVPRGFLSVLSDANTPTIDARGSGRREMAEWIASRDNPLTARVMVNRLWQHLFGRGIVASADDFGSMGERPSHPELLDYLAVRFMDEGWSIKRSVRQMVLSRTYRQASSPTVATSDAQGSAWEVDPDNRLLWRFDRRRLEAESLRDAVLAVSGELDLKRPFASTTLTLVNIELGSSSRILAMDDSPRHRAVYLPMLRGAVPEMLGLFDMADPSLVVGTRETTTVSTQALYLMNSKFVMDRSRRFAERVMQQSGSDPTARIKSAYLLALSRPPTIDEIRRVEQFVRENETDVSADARTETDVWSDVCHSLLSSAEFMYVQ